MEGDGALVEVDVDDELVEHLLAENDRQRASELLFDPGKVDDADGEIAERQRPDLDLDAARQPGVLRTAAADRGHLARRGVATTCALLVVSGAIALTRILSLPSSTARLCVKPVSAALKAA